MAAHEPSDAGAPALAAMLAAALLRTGAWLYGGLWVVTAAVSPWGPPGPLPVALIAAVAPVVLLVQVRSSARCAAASPPARRAQAPEPARREMAGGRRSDTVAPEGLFAAPDPAASCRTDATGG